MKTKIIAFTLAEVLITLGIIGVVAALTLPTLIQNYKEKQTVVKLKKTYSVLQNAFNMVRSQEHDGTDVDSWGDDYKNLPVELAKYMNVAKFCAMEEFEDCFPNSVTNLNGVTTRYLGDLSSSSYYGFILNDGTSLLAYMFVPTSQNFLAGKFGQIFVDINGTLPPNTLGRDAFSFFIYKDRIVPRGTVTLTEEQEQDTANTTYCDFKHTGTAHNGLGCTAHVINEENMDYLKK